MHRPHVAIVGAGIGGTVAALKLAQLGIRVDLYEQNNGILSESSAIAAHLYSGVQYFADIPQKSIKQLMLDAILFAKILPFALVPRPTVIALAKEDKRRPEELEETCKSVQEIYYQSIQDDPANKVFGCPSRFYETYTRKSVQWTQNKWIRSFAKYTDLERLQFPIFLVNEFGLDMRSARSHLKELLDVEKSISLHLSTEVNSLQLAQQGIWVKTASSHSFYNLLIDATGAKLGHLESQLGIRNHRMQDVKMAGLFTYSPPDEDLLPAIYILGGKGFPSGVSFMSHFSSLDHHGQAIVNITTQDCTYFEDGKQSNQGCGSITMCHPALQSNTCRLQNMIARLSTRHTILSDALQPLRPLLGCINILGSDYSCRDSIIDEHLDKFYVSLNLAKAGSAVRIATQLSELIEKYFKF